MDNAYERTRRELLERVKKQVSAAVDDDTIIIHAVSTLDLLERNSHQLAKKAREWLGLRVPEVERLVKNHEELLTLATTESAEALNKAYGVEESMGAAIDEAPLQELLNAIKSLYEEKERLQSYVEKVMSKRAPNLSLLATPRIAAQLLAHAGSLQKLATVPSSTVQLYGAETALFRHLRNRGKHRAPKYGVIYNHPLVQYVKAPLRGKAARSLADKLSLAAKIDAFSESTPTTEQGEKYKAFLTEKFGGWDS